MPKNVPNIVLRSEEVQEILEATPSWMIRWGNILVLSLIAMLLLLSWFIKYPDVIPSNAIITTEIPPQKEYAKSFGKIASILVVDDQNVHQDSPLAVLDNTASFRDVFLLKSILDTITFNSETFDFPITAIPILSLGDIQQSYSSFELDYLRYRNNKEFKPFSNDQKANVASEKELGFRLQMLESQKKSGLSELAIQKKDLDRNKVLLDKGVISAQDYERAQASYIRLENNIANVDNTISQTREAISNAKRTSRSTRINKTTEEIVLFKTVIQSLNQLKQAIKGWELSYVLKSNVHGKVSFLRDWKVNETVNQNELMFTIIPNENSKYIAQLRSPAQNSGKLRKGQTVNINLETYPSTEFGSLKGQIHHIGLFPDEEGLYSVKVALSTKLITSYKKEIPFKHEMNGTAEIVTEDLRLIERFLHQIRSVFKN